jgi:hypothetical protein
MSTDDAQNSDDRKTALLAVLFIVLLFVSFWFVFPDGTGDLTVAVEDQSGNSINHAQVSLDNGPSQPVTGPGATVTFQNVNFGVHNVLADAAGYNSNSTQVVVDEANEQLTIILNDSASPPQSGETTERFK